MIDISHLNKVETESIYLPKKEFERKYLESKTLTLFIEEKQSGNITKKEIPYDDLMGSSRLTKVSEGQVFKIGDYFFYKIEADSAYMFKNFDSLEIYPDILTFSEDILVEKYDYPQWKHTEFEDIDGTVKIKHILYETPGKIVKISDRRERDMVYRTDFYSHESKRNVFYQTHSGEWFLSTGASFIPEYKNTFAIKSDVTVMEKPKVMVILKGTEYLGKHQLKRDQEYLEVVTDPKSLITVRNSDIQTAVTSNSFTTLEQLQECEENIFCGIKYYLEIEKHNM